MVATRPRPSPPDPAVSEVWGTFVGALRAAPPLELPGPGHRAVNLHVSLNPSKTEATTGAGGGGGVRGRKGRVGGAGLCLGSLGRKWGPAPLTPKTRTQLLNSWDFREATMAGESKAREGVGGHRVG